MPSRSRRVRGRLALVLVLCAPVVLWARPASAFPPGDAVIDFSYKVTASTHIKKLNQTITPPPGTFKGGIDLSTQRLVGSITLPPATFTFALAGLVPLVTATAQIVQAKPVTGTINLSNFFVKTTSQFNIRILSAYAALPPIPLVPPVNLVGNSCTTSKPVSVTMSGTAHLGGTSHFSGTFTIPDFKSCGLATVALNQLIPGPGNTFTATVKS